MHPAYSVILFTTASGAGYGLLFWLSLGIQIGYFAGDRWQSLAMLVPALALITIGLLSSMLHLGHPERAHRAMSQWRSSWLSREGVAALSTYVPASLMGMIWLLEIDTNFLPALAILAAAGAMITVYCTGMIYASLRTIRHWNLGLVPLFYIAAAATTGALLFLLIQSIFARAPDWVAVTGVAAIAMAMIVKLIYWRTIDGNKGQYTAEMATGLGALGTVRPLDPPHTMPNFVMREMGYKVGRKHARKLRRVAVALAFILPLAMVLLALYSGWPQLPMLALATLSAAIGIVVERWLFFAEAEHVAMLYYGAARA